TQGTKKLRAFSFGLPAASSGFQLEARSYKLEATRFPVHFARPTRYFSPVGAGTPPSGSMVTATAATLATSRGVVNTAWTSPPSPGLSSPALNGASGVTIHT